MSMCYGQQKTSKQHFFIPTRMGKLQGRGTGDGFWYENGVQRSGNESVFFLLIVESDRYRRYTYTDDQTREGKEKDP